MDGGNGAQTMWIYLIIGSISFSKSPELNVNVLNVTELYI